MRLFKQGDRVTHEGKVCIILGPEDFEGYEYNYIDDSWELVRRLEDNQRYWISAKALNKAKDN